MTSPSSLQISATTPLYKPCPFCTGTPLLRRLRRTTQSPYSYHILCLNCKARTASFSSEHLAHRFWNRRATHFAHTPRPPSNQE